MSDLSSSRVLNLDGREIIVRELTVAGVRQMLMPDATDDVVGAALFEEVRLVDLQRMTSLSTEDVESLRPSQLRQVLDACREMNRDFFAMLARLASIQGKR
ncbi:hypothetical protein [Pseudomonas sp. RIT411]|uniref:hypothetical protein n=1 Tax=Pseudomonas sp. RIT411 TaxID=2202160 RepID=UPI000D37D6CB|nr:hypothetical protein [Pseudomonas sp. RIT 411]RAU40163.1 hypothetical protein DBY63_010220 [Pseudomonas sp. RIT 411]